MPLADQDVSSHNQLDGKTTYRLIRCSSVSFFHVLIDVVPSILIDGLLDILVDKLVHIVADKLVRSFVNNWSISDKIFALYLV